MGVTNCEWRSSWAAKTHWWVDTVRSEAAPWLRKLPDPPCWRWVDAGGGAGLLLSASTAVFAPSRVHHDCKRNNDAKRRSCRRKRSSSGSVMSLMSDVVALFADFVSTCWHVAISGCSDLTGVQSCFYTELRSRNVLMCFKSHVAFRRFPWQPFWTADQNCLVSFSWAVFAW